jgi:hypothetical protein
VEGQDKRPSSHVPASRRGHDEASALQPLLRLMNPHERTCHVDCSDGSWVVGLMIGGVAPARRSL